MIDLDLELINQQIAILAQKANEEGELSLEDVKKLQSLVQSKVSILKLEDEDLEDSEALAISPEELTRLLKK